MTKYECEQCAQSFDTLTRKRLHDCTGKIQTTTSPTEKYHICVDVGERSTDYAWHIIDTEIEYEREESLLGNVADMGDLRQRIIKYREQTICPHNGAIHGEAMPLEEANEHLKQNKQEFSGDPPEKICSYCWSEVKDRISDSKKEAETIDYSSTGFRLRWKQKGRAREEWYDIVVRPDTTFSELDAVLRAYFSTLDSMHGRLYGLEDEYMDSSLEIYGGIMEGIKGGHGRRDPPIHIKDIFRENRLAVGDRLSLAYDFGIHSSYYCIIKEKYDNPDSFIDKFDADELIEKSDTIAITKSKDSINTTNTESSQDKSNPPTDNSDQTKDAQAINSSEQSNDSEEEKTFDDAMETFSNQLSDPQQENKDRELDLTDTDV